MRQGEATQATQQKFSRRYFSMNAVAVVIKKLKVAIAKLNRQIAVGVRNARKYILKLIDAESKLSQLQSMDGINKMPATEHAWRLREYLNNKAPENRKCSVDYSDKFCKIYCNNQVIVDYVKKENEIFPVPCTGNDRVDSVIISMIESINAENKFKNSVLTSFMFEIKRSLPFYHEITGC